MLEQFSRTELLLGRDAIEKLSRAKVIVFGVGGVGGYAVEALARSGVGRIDLVDKDTVSLSNLNRQLIATRDTVGREKVEVMAGGSDRNSTIMNAINYIEENFVLDDDTIIVTHDAVRPFVTHRIIMDNIEAAVKVGACDTVIPATDTIVESLDGEKISSIPDRSKVYQGQTPQSFRAKRLKELYSSLTDEEKAILTDAAKIYLLKGEAVHLVRGEVFNIKITYPYDLTVAETLINTDRE